MEKLRSRVWSHNCLGMANCALNPACHLLIYMILAGCQVMFELTKKLALGMRLHTPPISDHVFASVSPKASGLQMAAPPRLCDREGRQES